MPFEVLKERNRVTFLFMHSLEKVAVAYSLCLLLKQLRTVYLRSGPKTLIIYKISDLTRY